METKKIKAFTLVELIVVITILAILGTIGFISLNGYSKHARNSVRISDISNIDKQLSLLIVKESKLPIPGEKIDLYASGELIGYQGVADKKVLGMIGIGNGGKDELDNSYYTYRVNRRLDKYQILGYLEDSDLAVLNDTYANDFQDRIIKTSGNRLGIFLDENSLEPVQYKEDDIDIVKTNTGYIVCLDDFSMIQGTGAELFYKVFNDTKLIVDQPELARYDEHLLLYLDMKTVKDGLLKDFSKNTNNATCNEGYGSNKIEYVCGRGGPKIKKGVIFDGKDDNILVPDPLVGEYDWTIEMDMNIFNFKEDDYIIPLCPLSYGYDQYVIIDNESNFGLHLTVDADDGERVRRGKADVETGDTYRYVFQRTNEYVYVYLNGKLIRKIDDTDENAKWEGDWIIGSRYWLQHQLNGKISSLKVFDRILTKTEILDSYMNSISK